MAKKSKFKFEKAGIVRGGKVIAEVTAHGLRATSSRRVLSNTAKVREEMVKYGIDREVAQTFAGVGGKAMDVGVPLDSAVELARIASHIARGNWWSTTIDRATSQFVVDAKKIAKLLGR